ncbi:hypothetical protein [Hazenella coriacea]|uniref:Uncharacterized protein n=1 Tax=Hazenella coriacea TaxID=1179467 RepID=A0A4R3LE84_9BACL|nr:hypothetical protein [Hazenella coriacea]TCS95756.1 hypothetical protein EDD58_102336 [Hazenella coriacea]
MQTDHYSFSEPTQDIPPVAKKWNWGAFFLNWIWGIGNNVWIAFLTFVPIVGWFAMPFVLGAKGGEWAWKNKEWQSEEHFAKVQRTWAWVGLGVFSFLFLIGLVASIISFFLIESFTLGGPNSAGEIAIAESETKLKVIELSGKESMTESVTLSKGFAILEADHYGDGPFVVKLLDKKGETLDYVFNEYGSYDGKRFITIDQDGIYSFKIEADGSWSIEIDQNTPEDLKTAPHEFTGRKDDVVFVKLENKKVRLHFTHDGKENFIVNMDGQQNLLVNEIGEYDDSVVKEIENNGIHAFSIKADGNWSFSVEYE